MSALKKALKILDLFMDTEDSLGLTEVAKVTGLNTATVYRILAVLEKGGYLERQKRKYSFSSKKIITLSKVILARLRIRNIALPFLHDLSQAVDETTQLAVSLGSVAYNIDTVYTTQMLNVRPSNESTIDLYSTGTGKIFLSYMSESEFQNYCNIVVFTPKTTNTITDLNELRGEFKKIKRDGVSFDQEEHILGIVGVAAPVTDSNGKIVAAIGIIAPRFRMDRQKTAEIGVTVKEYAAKLSDALKHFQDHPTPDGIFMGGSISS
jgi:DNA-binding IclR family transcriptional regulator